MELFLSVVTISFFIIWVIGWVVFITDSGWITYGNNHPQGKFIAKHRRKILWHQAGIVVSFILLITFLMLRLNPWICAGLFVFLFGQVSYVLVVVKEFPSKP